MRTSNNRIVVDLNKCQHAAFWYVNQYGQVVDTISPNKSVRLDWVFDFTLAFYHPDYPGETTLARAKRLNLLDIWIPVCQFQLTANHSLTYTGDKAVSMWKAWREKIFNKNK